MDLDLTSFFLPRSFRMPATISLCSCASRAQCTRMPLASQLLRELPQQLGQMGQHVQLHPAGGFAHLLPFREGLGLQVALVPQRQQGRGMPVDPGLVGGEGLGLAGVGLTHGLPRQIA